MQSVDTASEAYALSLAEKARIDMPYMSQLTGKTEQELFEDLKGVIFLNPMHISEEDGKPKYLPADEYLSGNVREKLRWAKRSAELYPEDYGENVRALEAVQPVDLTASEISVRLGATWLPPEIIEEFISGAASVKRCRPLSCLSSFGMESAGSTASVGALAGTLESVDTGSKKAGVSFCGVGAFDVFPAVCPCRGSAAHPESNTESRSAHNMRFFFMG